MDPPHPSIRGRDAHQESHLRSFVLHLHRRTKNHTPNPSSSTSTSRIMGASLSRCQASMARANLMLYSKARAILLHPAVLLVLCTPLLVFYLLMVAGVLVPGEEVPVDHTGYWKAANWVSLMVCFGLVAYLVSIIASARRYSNAMAGQLPPPPRQMDMC